jgi:pimeloyl-ACP methyl ester carboxylesterase
LIKVNDLIIADAGGILANGLARDQIVDMYNYYQKLITPSNSTVAQWVKKAETGPDGQPIYYHEKTGSASVLEKLAATTPLTVAGHSLGGQLAAAFTRLFPVSNAYAFNGAGFYETPYVNNFFDQLAGHAATFSPSRIKNIYGDAGEEVISNAWWHTQYGERIPVFIENQLQVPGPPLAFNHSMTVLSDAMALYDLFARIDPNKGVSFITTYLQVMAPEKGEQPALTVANKLENMLEAVADILNGTNGVEIPAGNRNAYWSTLLTLRDGLASPSGYTIKTLAGLSASSLESLGKDDIAYRYALRELNPFAIQGANYAPHNGNGELDLYDPSTGAGQITPQYLRDRGAFMEYLTANTGIAGQLLNNRSFYDAAREYQVGADADGKYVFEDGNADAIVGGSHKDHLYGGAGDDTIHGGDGDDYLQGDAGADELFGDKNDDLLLGIDGNDKLDGGEGIDSLQGGLGNDELKGGDGAYLDLLYGGEGDDTLIGGRGDDLLFGGKGNDTYKYTTGDGRDTIKDIDGLGSIIIDNQPALNGGKKIGDGVYRSDDKKYTYTFAGDLTLGGTLTINDSMIVEDFKNGNLGITLAEAEAPELARILAPGIGIATSQYLYAFRGCTSVKSVSHREA